MPKPSSYFEISEGHNGDEDKDGLLQTGKPRRNRRKVSKIRRFLLPIAAIILLVLSYIGGLVTEWKARPLSRFGGNNTTSSTGPKLQEIGNLTLPGRQGTGLNGPSLRSSNSSGNGGGGFFLGGPPTSDTTNDPSQQPITPSPDNAACKFEYKAQLGFDGMPLGDLLRMDGSLDRLDVLQGPLGDCGFIASVLAMVCSGRQQDLKAILKIPPGHSILEARFKIPTNSTSFGFPTFKTDIVKIDDRLPFSTLNDEERATAACWKYLAAQPGAGPAVLPPRPVLYVPLLEKAWAKYTDAHATTLRSFLAEDKNAVGYPGIEGTYPGLVIQALTGQETSHYRRKKEGFDAQLVGFIAGCIVKKTPCVLATPNAATLELIGTKTGDGPAITNEAGIIGTNTNGYMYDIIENPTGRVLSLVGYHAYAIDVENSDILDMNGQTNFETADVTILNPWGRNYDYKGSELPGAGIKIRLKTLGFVVDSVSFVK